MAKPKLVNKIEILSEEVKAIKDGDIKSFVFVLRDEDVQKGIPEIHSVSPFDCEVVEISCSTMTPSIEDIEIQIQKTSDNVNWVNLLNSPLLLEANQYESYIDDFLSDISINKRDKLRVEVVRSINDIDNLNVAISVKQT